MPSVLSSRPARRLLGPLRARLTAHSTRIARAQVEPVRRELAMVGKRLKEQATVLARLRRQVAQLATTHETNASRISELAGRVEALRYRYESLEQDQRDEAVAGRAGDR